MKKLFLLVLIFTCSINIYCQKADIDKVAIPLSQAEVMTIEMSKVYDFTPEQSFRVKEIQENKFQALSKLETLKAQDIKKYVHKRISAFELADNEMMAVMNERQSKIFKDKLAEKSSQYAALLTTMKKEGATENAILSKLSDMDF